MDSSPSRAAGILVFGALSTPIIAVVWVYWGTTWGLVAWGAALPLALVPWGIDATRRSLGRLQSRERRLGGQAVAGSAMRGAAAHRRTQAGAATERSPAERRRAEPSKSTVENR